MFSFSSFRVPLDSVIVTTSVSDVGKTLLLSSVATDPDTLLPPKRSSASTNSLTSTVSVKLMLSTPVFISNPTAETDGAVTSTWYPAAAAGNAAASSALPETSTTVVFFISRNVVFSLLQRPASTLIRLASSTVNVTFTTEEFAELIAPPVSETPPALLAPVEVKVSVVTSNESTFTGSLKLIRATSWSMSSENSTKDGGTKSALTSDAGVATAAPMATTAPPLRNRRASGRQLGVAHNLTKVCLTVSEKVSSSWSVLKSSLKLECSGPVVTDTNVLADFSPASASDATATPVVSAAKLPSTDRTPPPSS